MNFFQEQAQAQKKTTLLIVAYVISVIAIIALIYLGLNLALNADSDIQKMGSGIGIDGGGIHWDLGLLGMVTASILAIIGGGSATKIFLLSGGGSKVAEYLGGSLVAPNTTDLLERRLLNVVEEMAIASGTPVPKVYLLHNEQGVNAFAAGTSLDNAAIGVTKGCMELLSRDELQGVIAHEFSHILNGDMKLNIRLIAVLSGILILSQIGYWSFRIGMQSGGSRRRSSNGKDDGGRVAALFVGLLVMVVGYIGVVCARIIKSAVSRQREFLADASAVQFTRNPDGIAGALKKIGGLQQSSMLTSDKAEEASHMFFSTGLSFSSLFATHPPLDVRVKKIDPSFDGAFEIIEPFDVLKKNKEEAEKQESKKRTAVSIPGMEVLAETMGGATGVLMGGGAIQGGATIATSGALLQNIGTLDAEHIQFARSMRESLPESIREACHDPVDARGLICALLILSSSEEAESVFSKIEGVFTEDFHEDGMRDSVLKLMKELSSLSLSYRLPLVEMCIPALGNLSKGQRKDFIKLVHRIVMADGEVSLFEYALSKIVTNRMRDTSGVSHSMLSSSPTLEELSRECHRLLAVVARFGSANEVEQEKAFSEGVSLLAVSSSPSLSSMPMIAFRDLDSVLDALVLTSFTDRERLIKACYHAISSDSKVTLEESEVFRAISDTLEVPVPPLLVL